MTDSVATQIDDAEKAWVEIYLRNDAEDLDALLADDFSYTSPAGEQVDRAQYLINLRDDVVHMSYIRPQDLRVRVYRQDVAVVTGTWHVSERYRDTQAEGAFRIIRVWVRQGRQWRAAAFQVTAVQDSA